MFHVTHTCTHRYSHSHTPFVVCWGALCNQYKEKLIAHFSFLKYSFSLFYFWLRCVFVAVLRLSLVVASGGCSSLWFVGFSSRWLLLLWSMGSRLAGFSSCGAQAQYLWHTGLIATQHVGSSRTRAGTHVPCIGRRILNHCATREVPEYSLLLYLCSCFALCS